MSFLVETEHGVEILIKVIPRASRSEIFGLQAGSLKVRLNSPPVDGAANKELIKLISKQTGIPKSRIEIIRGSSSRSKSVLLHDAKLSSVRMCFSDWI